MELTEQEKQIVINLLSQISVPVNQALVVLKIIEKLQASSKKEEAKSVDK